MNPHLRSLTATLALVAVATACFLLAAASPAGPGEAAGHRGEEQ
jgi:hypothetical protein